MYKKTIKFEDWDGNPVEDTFYFNMTKVELMENLTLQDELLSLQSDISGDTRELTNAEITRILKMVKTIMSLSYGVRSEDGKRFRKSPELFQEFTETPAYDALLFNIFTDDQGAMSFVSGIIPSDLMEKVRQEQEPTRPKVPLDHLQKATAQELSAGSQGS